MLFQVTAIEFDFEGGEALLPEAYQNDIIARTKLCSWEARDGDDLIEQITDDTSWCVKFIEYTEITK
jgi:hypothetical protein